MNLEEMYKMFVALPQDKVLEFGISEPFSWRGSYDEVAFVIVEGVTAGECVRRINMALSDTFDGYKGGQFSYTWGTPVNFEPSFSSYTDGEYREDIISNIEDQEAIYDRDKYLVKLMTAN